MAKREYKSKIAEQTAEFTRPEREKAEGQPVHEVATDPIIHESVQIPAHVKKEPPSILPAKDVNPDIESLIMGQRKEKAGKQTRSFYMDDKTYGKLKGLADRNQMSTSEVLALILKKYL